MKIFGIGMNYRPHVAELQDKAPGRVGGNDDRLAEPAVFTNCDSALVNRGNPFFVPYYTEECEHEAELVVRISRMGRSISQRFAHRYYDAITVGVDFTARDIQRRLRAQGLPWDLAKGFDGSAVVGEWREFAQIPNPNPGQLSTLSDLLKAGIDFRLEKNGQPVQHATSRDMIYDVDYIVSYLSRYFTLKTGDIIYTGTPAGVGRVDIDDHIVGYLGEDKVLEFNVK